MGATREKGVLPDDEIVELYFKRDERAIVETDVKYKSYLIAIALGILNDMADSEECLNDTYLGAWNAMPPTRPNSLKAFLAVIIRRTAIDRYKSTKRKKRISSSLTLALSELEGILSDDNDKDGELEAVEIGLVISEFLRSLSDRKMYIFMSRYYMARSISEIAERLGCSESTVNKEIATIKRQLRSKLEKEGYSI